jgi:hypothetical protein
MPSHSSALRILSRCPSAIARVLEQLARPLGNVQKESKRAAAQAVGG